MGLIRLTLNELIHAEPITRSVKPELSASSGVGCSDFITKLGHNDMTFAISSFFKNGELVTAVSNVAFKISPWAATNIPRT